MLGNIIEIIDDKVKLKLAIDISQQTNFLGVHVVFDDGDKTIVGEIVGINKDYVDIHIVGSLKDNTFIIGSIDRPSFKSKCNIINMQQLEAILGSQTVNDPTKIFFAYSTIYKNFKINVDTNKFFSNHFAILGNTGSGKSCSFARIIQNCFMKENPPVNSKFLIFDAYGEYVQAFSQFHSYNSNLATKIITTDPQDQNNHLFKLPIWLLDVDDLALLLNVDKSEQLPILIKAINLANLFVNDSEEVEKLKNDTIARSILEIIRSGKSASILRDQITAVLTSFGTKQLNLNSIIYQPGYSRSLKQCLNIDNTGKIQEMELVVEYISKFIQEKIEVPNSSQQNVYTLKDLKNALDFALISEGIFQSDKVYDYANVLSVRLQTLINSEYNIYFDIDKPMTRASYINWLYTTREGKLAQLLDFNINYVDDRMAKIITKILARMLFNLLIKSPVRGANPIHIIIEEAHRYVQEDNDLKILGYNIFDRISKEGRKYGAILGLITQRPSELTDTSLSQCSNFIILRTLHPKDLNYIANMVPSISSEGIKAVKNLQAGTALAFGTAFPMSLILKFPLAQPLPLSNNSDISKIWYIN